MKELSIGVSELLHIVDAVKVLVKPAIVRYESEKIVGEFPLIEEIENDNGKIKVKVNAFAFCQFFPFNDGEVEVYKTESVDEYFLLEKSYGVFTFFTILKSEQELRDYGFDPEKDEINYI